jgi:hypothetical protein
VSAVPNRFSTVLGMSTEDRVPDDRVPLFHVGQTA